MGLCLIVRDLGSLKMRRPRPSSAVAPHTHTHTHTQNSLFAGLLDQRLTRAVSRYLLCTSWLFMSEDMSTGMRARIRCEVMGLPLHHNLVVDQSLDDVTHSVRSRY
jgi:hypothetical protein